MRAAAAVGLIGSVGLLLGGGRLRVEHGVAPPDWLGLLGPARTAAARDIASAAVLGGFVLLGVAALQLLRLRPRLRTAASTVGVWSLPLLVGPPVGSLDVFSYAGQGRLLQHGLDPTKIGVAAAGEAFSAAADPRWRAAKAPYGPLALLDSHAAAVAGGGDVVATVVVLRVVAVLSLVVAVAVAVRMSHDPLLAVVVAGSPLVLVTVVSAAHHEAMLTAFAVAAVSARLAGWRTVAVVLAAGAAAVKVPGLVVLAGVIALDLAEASGWRGRGAALLRAGPATVAVWGLLALAVPDVFGWVHALSTPGDGHTPLAPVTIAANVFPGGAHGWRTAGQVVAAVVVALLLVGVRRRGLAATVGWGLLAVGLLGPVLYPWYLVPAAIVLATTPGRAGRAVSMSAATAGPWLAVPRLG